MIKSIFFGAEMRNIYNLVDMEFNDPVNTINAMSSKSVCTIKLSEIKQSV